MPTKYLVGLLALLHAASSLELRRLKVSDVNLEQRTDQAQAIIAHPVPLDPAQLRQRCSVPR